MADREQELRYQDLHPALVKDAARGKWTILDFFDSCAWVQGGADWTPWRAFLAALYGLPMTDKELAIYRECTGRWAPPTEPAREAWVPVGRRGRKSAILAMIAVYVAAYRDHSRYLAPGERARIPIVSKTIADAGQVKRYVDSILSHPSLSWMVVRSLAESIELLGGIEISVRAPTRTAGRAPSSPLAVLDEVAFWQTESGSANPDAEIVSGIRPSMARVPGSMLVAVSSPYARRGLLWEAHQKHFGVEGSPILVWQAPTLRMHDDPQIREFVAMETAKDPVAAAAEYGASFRADVAAFLSSELLDAATATGVAEIAPADPRAGVQYVAFVDASGGRSDSFVCSVAHQDGTVTVQDAVLEIPAPFDPIDAVDQVVAMLRQYRVQVVEGDNYAGDWVSAAFQRYGVQYQVTEKSRSQIYVEMLPLLTTAGRVRLLDLPEQKKQFLGLDRTTGSTGREIIDHAPGAHDDIANAVAGALVRASRLKLKAKPNAQPQNPLELRRAKIREVIQQALERAADGSNDRMPSGGY